MPDNALPQSSLILYQTEDGRTRIQCRFENDTIWLTQGELSQDATIRKIRMVAATIRQFRIVRSEGEVFKGRGQFVLPLGLTAATAGAA
jgi:hypothetical protein